MIYYQRQERGDFQMTPEEISKFVNRPAPRDIPKNVWRAAGKPLVFYALGAFGFLIFLLFFLFLRAWMLPGDILLDIGNKKVTQGVVIGHEPLSKLNSVSGNRTGGKITRVYRVSVRFPARNGEVTANCYAYDDDKKIYNTAVNDEVVVEYIPWYPSIARATGARLSLVYYSSEVMQFILMLFGLAGCCYVWYRRRRLKRLLANGRFASGRVLEIDLDWWKKHRFRARIYSIHQFLPGVVSFNDQYGAARTGRYYAPISTLEIYNRWAAAGRAVGLLYLPGRKDVAVTDLWLSNLLETPFWAQSEKPEGCYALLGIPPTATSYEIEEAYQKKKIEFGSDTSKQKELDSAYNEATTASFAPLRASSSPMPTGKQKKPQPVQSKPRTPSKSSLTSQEISNFVGRPTPRGIPKNVWRAAIGDSPLAFLVLFLIATGLVGLCWYSQNWYSQKDLLESLFVTIAMCAAVVYIWRRIRIQKRLLMEGRYAAGRIYEVKSHGRGQLCTVVSFSDQHGTARKGSCLSSQKCRNTVRQWFAEDRHVGLLYLPDRQDVIITDLWEL